MFYLFWKLMFNPFLVKKEEYLIFKQIVLDSSEGKQKDKQTLIEMVKLCYRLQGKGKIEKRELLEILEIIEKNLFKINPNIKCFSI